MIDSMNEQSKEGERPSNNIYISNPLRASVRKEGVKMIVISIEKIPMRGGCDVMSEETKTFFLESVKSAALLWCNKAISSDDFFKILNKTVNETEKKMKIDPEAWTV